jgi:hypothetical protein
MIHPETIGEDKTLPKESLYGFQRRVIGLKTLVLISFPD